MDNEAPRTNPTPEEGENKGEEILFSEGEEVIFIDKEGREFPARIKEVRPDGKFVLENENYPGMNPIVDGSQLQRIPNEETTSPQGGESLDEKTFDVEGNEEANREFFKVQLERALEQIGSDRERIARASDLLAMRKNGDYLPRTLDTLEPDLFFEESYKKWSEEYRKYFALHQLRGNIKDILGENFGNENDLYHVKRYSSPAEELNLGTYTISQDLETKKADIFPEFIAIAEEQRALEKEARNIRREAELMSWREIGAHEGGVKQIIAEVKEKILGEGMTLAEALDVLNKPLLTSREAEKERCGVGTIIAKYFVENERYEDALAIGEKARKEGFYLSMGLEALFRRIADLFTYKQESKKLFERANALLEPSRRRG